MGLQKFNKRKIFHLGFVLCILLFQAFATANCQGCCSQKGGVICKAQLTRCGDGSPLSKKCQAKGCEVCTKKQTQHTHTTAKISSSALPSYERKLYPHWIDANRNCRNTRHEILSQASEIPPTYKTPKKCLVISGRWQDPYSGKTFYKTKDIDIDHIVPLSYAHKKGAHSWSRQKRRAFANDPENLIPVHAPLNRQKGAKAPDEWLPPSREYHCDYLKRWLAIEKKYQLNKTRSLASEPLQQIKQKVCAPKNALK